MDWVIWSQLETRCRIESQQQTEGFGSSVTHSWATQPRWGKSAAMVRRTWGQYSSLFLSPAHLSHTTNISSFECERYIFIKKCVRSFIEVRHYCWLCFHLYLCYVYVCGYTTMVNIRRINIYKRSKLNKRFDILSNFNNLKFFFLILHRCGTKENLDPHHCKSWQTQKTLFNNPKVYSLTSLVGTPLRERKSVWKLR